jgi:DNA mismatch repair ATPase MutS
MNSKTPIFQNRITKLQEQVNRLKSKSGKISVLRIISFLTFAILFIVFLNIRVFTPIVLLSFVFFTGFGLLVRYHNKIKQSLQLYQKMIQINQEEIERLNYKFKNFNKWDQFSDEQHAYSGDLDLYGKNSLFQLINRAETQAGIYKMKSWLENYANKNTIETRQKAVQELIPLVEWRQKIQAHGRKKMDDTDSGLYDWLKGKDSIRNSIFYKIVSYPVMLIAIVLIIGILYQMIPLFYIFPVIIFNGVLLMKKWDYSKTTYELTSSSVKLLQSIRQIIILIENQKFHHEHLNQIKSGLIKNEIRSSEKILKLQKIFDLLNLRGNQMYHIFNIIFLLDFIFLLKAERWRAKYKNEISEWFDNIAEMEALNSIAAFAFANEKYIFPKVNEGAPIFSAEKLGHPLIPSKQRINNDFQLKGKGAIGVVTGSNMSGKSTFLRTIGVNAVLAFAGAPVCADQLELSIFQVFTSMRTKDNLEENISSFYAELLRLKMLLQNINENRPVLFLLDEILKGTNSADRHIGAESLIIQLSQLNAFGLISTHDLKLGKLKLKTDKLRNYNFSSSIDGQEIIFDFKLRDGICRSTNASQLMAKIGIQIDLST